MIEHKDMYFDYIKAQGVGDNDTVKDASPKSYVSYLRSTATALGIKISPKTVRNYNDVEDITLRLSGKRADSTIKKYGTALRKYADMVKKFNL